ncbi:MAG TPA: hypothetical protein PKY22_03780 [Accumulibacter sp.]|nr:hypothetical protein [Accumulibacter sp.]
MDEKICLYRNLEKRIQYLEKLAGKLESSHRFVDEANKVREVALQMRRLLLIADKAVYWLKRVVSRLDSYQVHDDIENVRRFNDFMLKFWRKP